MAKNDEKVSKSKAKPNTLLETSVEYRNQMAQEKLKRLKLQNGHQEFDLRKKEETICYRAVAMKEFERAISDIYARIKNTDEQLTARLQLTQQQQDLLHEYVEDILIDLSNIDINLSTTESFDAENYLIGCARRNQILQTGE